MLSFAEIAEEPPAADAGPLQAHRSPNSGAQAHGQPVPNLREMVSPKR